jgi:hypothetical protein
MGFLLLPISISSLPGVTFVKFYHQDSTPEVLKESLRQKKGGQKRVFCPQEIQK